MPIAWRLAHADASRGDFACVIAVSDDAGSGNTQTGPVFAVLDLRDSVTLIGAANGLFRYDPGFNSLRPAGKLQTGRVFDVYTPRSGDTQIRTDNGFFQYDPGSNGLERLQAAENIRFRSDLTRYGLHPAGNVLTGPVFIVSDLQGGNKLIGAAFGLFRYNSRSNSLQPANTARTGPVFAVSNLPGDDKLIGAANGLFRYDFTSNSLQPVGNAQTGGVFNIFDLPDGDKRIRAENGTFFVPKKSLADANVRPVGTNIVTLGPSEAPVEAPVRVQLDHPCAFSGNELDLRLVVKVEGQEHSNPQATAPRDGTATETSPTFTALVKFDRTGKWTGRLQQHALEIGESFPIKVNGQSLLDWIAAKKGILVGGVTGLLALYYIALLIATRWSAWAFRAVTDSFWAHWRFSPLYVLRHFATVQCWVMEPWFQAVRRSIRDDPRYHDPPVTRPDAPAGGGAALLERLRTKRLVWLHGRSGMGKSVIFQAWKRDYFQANGVRTLRAAVQANGFILIPLQVQQYAMLAPPDVSGPQSWIIEAVRLHLEQSGLSTQDRNLIEAMLRSGRFAIALDGTNEAERDAAIAAFAEQFPGVRMIVTSQSLGLAVPQGPNSTSWDVWQLPETITDLREGLLKHWLGEGAGVTVAKRIINEGLAGEIVSGYDLRLIEDLVKSDPSGAALPKDRVGLYRAILARARSREGDPLRLDGLMRVAWTMVIGGRRDISADDDKALGAGVLAALAQDGVRIVRPVGTSYQFRHDQMRAFLAASWLVEEIGNIADRKKTMADDGVFRISARDQEEVWRFVALLIVDDDLIAFWHFTNDEPERRLHLRSVLEAEADRRGVTLVRAPRETEKVSAGD